MAPSFFIRIICFSVYKTLIIEILRPIDWIFYINLNNKNIVTTPDPTVNKRLRVKIAIIREITAAKSRNGSHPLFSPKGNSSSANKDAIMATGMCFNQRSPQSGIFILLKTTSGKTRGNKVTNAPPIIIKKMSARISIFQSPSLKQRLQPLLI